MRTALVNKGLPGRLACWAIALVGLLMIRSNMELRHPAVPATDSASMARMVDRASRGVTSRAVKSCVDSELRFGGPKIKWTGIPDSEKLSAK